MSYRRARASFMDRDWTVVYIHRGLHPSRFFCEMEFKIRAAAKEDCEEIYRMIMVETDADDSSLVFTVKFTFSVTDLWNFTLHFLMSSFQELAVFENMPDQVKISHRGEYLSSTSQTEILGLLSTVSLWWYTYCSTVVHMYYCLISCCWTFLV